MLRAGGLAALSLLLVGGLARAQELPRTSPHRLYLGRNFYAGMGRALALGGAYVAVAEGAAYTSNHASFAQPSPWEGDTWSLDLTLEAATTAGNQDLDNDGAADGDSTYQALVGVSGRVSFFGAGAYGRASETRLCPSESCTPEQFIRARSNDGGLALSLAGWEGQLVLAGGVYGSTLLVTGPGLSRTYDGAGLGADLLYRPAGRPYRVAASFRSQQASRLLTAGSGDGVGGRALPHSTITPPQLSLGAAARLDEGREGFNVPRPRDDDPLAPLDPTNVLRDMFRARREKPPGRWMVAAQVDLTFPVKDAVPLAHFLRGAAPLPMGTRLLLTPRFGVEHVTAPGKLRLRGGTYLEPSPAGSGSPRLHLTAGFDLFLFHLLFDWGLTGAVDVASRLQQGTVSFGVWH